MIHNIPFNITRTELVDLFERCETQRDRCRQLREQFAELRRRHRQEIAEFRARTTRPDDATVIKAMDTPPAHTLSDQAER